MCYSAGSIDQPCPMCCVYNHSKCPHVRDVCRNRANHPRMDVLFLTNAEVASFNGCGFCKWAINVKPAGYSNPGWPGCCRPPAPNEHRLVQIEDWHAVSAVHRIPIPPQIDVLLRSLPLPSAIRTSHRKNSSASNVLAAKAMNMPSLPRGRSPLPAPISSIPRPSSANPISSSLPPDHTRRKTNPDKGTQSSHSSPGRKCLDLENPTSPRRASTVRRPALTPATTSVSLSKVVAADSRSPRLIDPPVTRRSSISAVPYSPRTPDRPSSFLGPRKKDDDCSASSSSGSSDGRGSLSDSTVTSDGGFTDYLSDESEAELQRQAEAKAVVVAQNQMEELEFKMARQQLAHVGLRPPKSWNPINTTSPKLSIQ